MRKNIHGYSYYQFFFYNCLWLFYLLFKFSFFLLSFKDTNRNIGEKFAAASALLLLYNILTCSGPIWSLVLLGFAWLYVFQLSPFHATLYFNISLLLFSFIFFNNRSTVSSNPYEKISSHFKMPTWLYVFGFILFLSGPYFYFSISKGHTQTEILFLEFSLLIFLIYPSWFKKTSDENSQKQVANQTTLIETQTENHPIVFFDGQCVFCNGFTRFLFAEDKSHVLRFSPLQGIYAKKLLGERAESSNSVILYDNGKRLQEIDALREIFKFLGGLWGLLAWMSYIFPRELLNIIYRSFSRKRYSWFGSFRHCPLPPPEAKIYFYE